MYLFQTVMNSKMPKGVEHKDATGKSGETEKVMNSKMPKGVEHREGIAPSPKGIRVMNSKMPKGVEHVKLRAKLSLLQR